MVIKRMAVMVGLTLIAAWLMTEPARSETVSPIATPTVVSPIPTPVGTREPTAIRLKWLMAR